MKLELINYDQQNFDALLNSGRVTEIIDSLDQQIEELFFIRNPSFKNRSDSSESLKQFIITLLAENTLKNFGSWFIFPWDKKLVHYLPENLHLELRTARNKNLISDEVQRKFYNSNIGIAGLSVGSHAAYTIVMMGGAKSLKLADSDLLSGSNLNRVRYDFTQIGKRKIDLAAHGIWRINPYSSIDLFSDGITEESIHDFFAKDQKITILVEEVDNLKMKFLLRFEAKKLRIPVIMATDNGDNVILDVERYDLEPELEIFNGAIGDITLEEFLKLPKETLPLLIGNIVGIDEITPDVFTSLAEVGKTLYSWPQLGSAANMSGSIIAYAARLIVSGQTLRSGKYHFNIQKILSDEN